MNKTVVTVHLEFVCEKCGQESHTKRYFTDDQTDDMVDFVQNQSRVCHNCFEIMDKTEKLG